MSHAMPFGNIFRLLISTPEELEIAINEEEAANLDDFGLKDKAVVIAEETAQIIERNRETQGVEPPPSIKDFY